MPKMQKQCNIKIYQDWDKIRSMYDTLLDKKLSGEIKNITHKPTMTIFSMGSLGSLQSYTHHGPPDWTLWSGKLLEKQLHWATQARDFFSGLNFNGFSWNSHAGNVSLHVDHTEPDIPICKINYIVRSDDINAKTISYDPTDKTYTETYYSIPDTAWLLKITKPHEVVNIPSGKRETLQFSFNNEFDDIAEYIDIKGPITFGNEE
jgi:hypothetical protein